jgi:glycosyltransferase involved in cell wall biosynthesis
VSCFLFFGAKGISMRIWFAAAQQRDTFGGVYRSVFSLAETLKKQGHEVTMYWCRREGRRQTLFFPLQLLLRLAISIFRRPHWIIARSNDGFFCAAAARLGLVPGTRVAMHSHGWEEKVFSVEKRLPKSVLSHPTTWKARVFRFPLLRATLALADCCICGTVEEARYVAARYPRHARKIRVIANGVEKMPAAFWPAQKERPPSFLIVGGFTWKKNVEYGIEVFRAVHATVPEARLFIVGTRFIPPSKQTLIDSLGDAVYVVEREHPKKMFRWYETCPFLISPSRYEGGRSLAILEAQDRGMVVFASAIPSSKEIIRDGATGILLSGCDAERDSALIIETVGNDERCVKIGNAAWRGANRQSWDRQAQRLVKVLRKCR